MAASLPIVFIGPMCAGKSTLSHALGIELGIRYVPLDAVRFYYYLRSGFSFAEMLARPNFEAVVGYWKPFEIDALEQVVGDFDDSIVDLGAGHAHYTDSIRLERLDQALGPLPNVFLVLPCLDLERAEQICLERDKARHGAKWDPTRAKFAREFVRSESFRRVAKHTIVTEDRSVEQSVKDVLAKLRRPHETAGSA